jgi:16S rRNA (cytosine967-C5)-methyltransferase
LQDRDIVYQPSKFVKGSFILEGSAGAINDLAQDGLIYIQDEGSQLVASAVDMTKESAFLDACAAPGGKTLFQREKTAGFAAKFFAGDHQPHRVASLKRNLSKYGANDVNIVAYDAGKALPFADETFDSVLVDAPCSGTGTIRQNPEIRWNLREGDFARLAQKQKAILTNSASVIRPGGVLIYSTCSLETEENEEVIESFLNSDRNFQIQPPNVLKQFITQRGFARTFPHRDQMGGFFIAALKRAK